MSMQANFDAVVIGGGFYGSTIAIHLSKHHRLKNILLIEQEGALLTKASYNNQARVHNGYHYPRSFTTAYRSRINFPHFIKNWPDAIKSNFTKLYAIARRNSKVTAKQFERFCHKIGAPIQPAPLEFLRLFDTRFIENVYLVQEYAFDSSLLAKYAHEQLAEQNIPVCFHTKAQAVYKQDQNTLRVILKTNDSTPLEITSSHVFNCTYSALNQIKGDFPGTQIQLKQEITEMAVLKVPPALKHLGVTVMDGPFFSVMPFPASGLHTLSHVRYTPHMQWEDRPDINPYQQLANYEKQTRVDRMARDASRFLPLLKEAQYVDSLFEVKTILVKNEGDDGRPILFEKYADLPGYYSVLGSKIDNIYDVLEKIDMEFKNLNDGH